MTLLLRPDLCQRVQGLRCRRSAGTTGLHAWTVRQRRRTDSKNHSHSGKSNRSVLGLTRPVGQHPKHSNEDDWKDLDSD